MNNNFEARIHCPRCEAWRDLLFSAKTVLLDGILHKQCANCGLKLTINFLSDTEDVLIKWDPFKCGLYMV